MRKPFETRKTRCLRLIKSEKSTLHKLNYLTLKIDSEVITKDLYQHSLDQKISLFWVSNLLALFNFIIALISYF